MTKSRPLPPLERVRELFEYQPETGWLTWKVSPSRNTKTGSRAGCVHPTGYRSIRIDGMLHREHRLIWLLSYGKDPGKLQVDHINGEKADNRIANLRLATNAENRQNQTRLRSSNTSGVAGVCWNKWAQKWRARIHLSGHFKHLGYFDSLEDAATARRAAELEHYGEFAPQRVVHPT